MDFWDKKVIKVEGKKIYFKNGYMDLSKAKPRLTIVVNVKGKDKCKKVDWSSLIGYEAYNNKYIFKKELLLLRRNWLEKIGENLFLSYIEKKRKDVFYKN